MISEQYRALNAQLHTDREDYGTSGQKYTAHVRSLYIQIQPETILDYGAGKCTLSQSAPDLPIINYDPCIPELNIKPEPADLVVCTDVLEHVEPEHVDAVIADLVRLTKDTLFLFVATGPACKTLADGRNAHVSIHSHDWWLDKFIKAGMAPTTIGLKPKGFTSVLI